MLILSHWFLDAGMLGFHSKVSGFLYLNICEMYCLYSFRFGSINTCIYKLWMLTSRQYPDAKQVLVYLERKQPDLSILLQKCNISNAGNTMYI